MHATTKSRGLNIGAIIATLIAAVFIGVFALMLMGRDSATGESDVLLNEPSLPQQSRLPQTGDKFAPGRIQPATLPTFEALCHGEGLLDTQMQSMLIGESSSVAQYCGTVAGPAGGQDADETQPDSTYPEACHGEGLLVPMDPAPYNDGPGSIAEYCVQPTPSGDEQDTAPLLPADDGPGTDPRNY